MDSKESSRDSRDRSRSDHSSKSREGSHSGSRSESREKGSKSEAKSSKLEHSKARSESKHSSSKSDSPDKKSRRDHSSDADRDKSKITSPGEPEHKEPIKLKLSLSQIRFASSQATDDSNDSATSYEDYEETRKRTKSRKEGSSSKKKRSKDKSKKSKSASVDPDTLAPPELELMETGESTLISEAEANLLTDPEPLSLQEDTMDVSTDSLTGGNTPYRESDDAGLQLMAKTCAFCACGERSLLGQGDMDRYEPTVGFNPFRKLTLKASKKPSTEVEERGVERGPKPLTSRRSRAPLKTSLSDELKSPRRCTEDQCEGFDELATVGHPEDTEVSTVIEPTGHTSAHHCCAAWSDGVLQTEEYMLQFVDKAVVAGLSKKCSYCLRYGATINCRYSKCNKIFHYPCASAGGCFQDIKSLSLLCPEHTEEAQTIAGEEALCVVCNIVGNIHEQLFCTSCGHHYHGNCLHPPVEVNPIVRAGWQCPDCKICQMCRQPGDDSKMLVCDMCDKGYHTFCLKPVMTTIPKNGWKCKNCRVCEDCGSRTPGSGKSSRWHLNYTVCDSCYQQRNKGLSCPLCGKAYRHFSQKAMVQCNLCKKLVHSECDDTIDAGLLLQVKNEEPTDYMCTICRNRDTEMDMPDFPMGIGMIEDSSDSFHKGLTGSEIPDDYGEDSQHTSDFLLNEDSMSSLDIEFSLLEKMSPTYSGEVSGKGKLVAMARKKMSAAIAAKIKNRQMAPEKRKRPLTFGEKRRGPKPKIGVGLPSMSSIKKSVDPDDEEDDHPNTIVLARKDDSYVLDQDVCKSCGSYGRGDEGRLIVCTQCGQCYHPYCASIKVTRIVIQKGWRCLDCTVCEGCGQPHDEGRLLLCDECDISYHTYCLDPPLDHVPKGTWKCKWCVVCLICGSTNPGFGCQWQRNYTHCGPCHSKISCPVCRMRYQEEQLIIQCVQCDRWLHGFCDGIHNEEDAEKAADFGYHCIFCRPLTGQPGPLPPAPLPPSPPMIERYLPLALPVPPPPPKDLEPPRFYMVDGILLSTSGRNLIESIRMEAPKIKRTRRWGKKPEGWDDKRGEIEKKMEEIMAERRGSQDAEPSMSAPIISRMLSIGSVDDDDKEMEDFKSPDEGGPDEIMPMPGDPAGKQNLEAQAMALLAEEKKQKKKRNTSRLGVGGFVVKPRFKPRAKRQPSLLSDGLEGEEGVPRPLEGEEPFPLLPAAEEKKQGKRRQGFGQGRRKSQLQENFPSYMQEAFFGREVLDRSKDAPIESLKAMESDEEKSPLESPKSLDVKEESEIAISSEQLMQQISEKHKLATELAAQGVSQASAPTETTGTEDDDLDIDIDIDIEDEFINMFGDELLQEEMESDGVEKPKTQPTETDNLDLPHLDKHMDIDSMLSEGLAHIDSKTVEDIFKGVLQGPEGQAEAPPQPAQPSHPLPPQHPPSVHPEVPYPGPLPRVSHAPPDHPLPPHHQFPPFPGPLGAQHPPSFDPNFPPSWPHALPDDSAGQDSSRRNMQKWESDEDLGPNATISPILYCNMIHPELKQQYPDWSERSKQIAKIWRKLTSDEKQPYLLKARKNRGTYKAKLQATKVTPERRKKQDAMGQMVFPSPEGPPGMQSPMHPSPGGMQSPMRPGMMPGTPEGQSPSHSLPGMSESPGHPIPLPGFPGQEHPFQKQPSVGDPFAHPSPSIRPQDPFSMPPPTPRTPMSEQYAQGAPRGPVPDPYHSPTGRLPDPYSQPPGTPRAADHTSPHEQFRSPVKDPYMHSPGVGPSGEPFVQPPGTPRSQPQSVPRPPLQHHPTWPHEGEPFERPPFPGPPRQMVPQPGVPPNAQGLRPPMAMNPRFMRQMSEPGGAPMTDDPYAFPPGTPGMEGGPPHPGIRMSVANAFSVPPGTPQPPRMPERQMSMPGEGQMPPSSMGQFRPPFRPPIPHSTPNMMRLPTVPHDPYSQQPGTPRPGMEHPPEMMQGGRPPEPSVLQQMYAAANRRQIFPPLSRMWPLSLTQTLATGAQTDIQKQQLREILAQQTKQNLMKKEQQGQEGGFTEPRPPGFPPGVRMPMPASSGTPTSAGPGHPPLHMMFPTGMRPPLEHMRPPGELTPDERKKVLEYFQQKVKEQAAQFGHIPPNLRPPIPMPPPELTGQQHPGPHPVPPTSVAETGTPLGDAAGKETMKRPPGVKIEGRIPKPSVSSEEEKTDDADELGDFLGEDGTFDILKYADPDLDLLGSDNKTIFDDLVDDSKEPEDKKEGGEKKDVKREEKPMGEETDVKTEDGEKPGSVSEFQAKFLEFSQRKQASEEEAKSDLKKHEAGVSHIAAMLQNAEHAGRPHSVKSEGGETESQTPTTPGTPMTPTGQDPNAVMAARGQGQFGVQSPAHPGLYPGQTSTQPSPAGSGFGQPTSGLPSPKVQPSPKSQPSPRTPGDPTVQGQQHSPFSQHSIQSPFSPSATAGQSPYAGTPTSAPQSPFAGIRPQSPFAVPGTSGAQQQLPPHINQGSPLPTSYSPGHTPPTAFPMQRSPRATMVAGNQYVPGTFPQPPFGPGVPQRGTLASTRGPVPYGQPGMRPQGPPGSAPSLQPPATAPVSQQQSPGQQMMPGSGMPSPGLRPHMMGVRPPFPPHAAGPALSPGQQVAMYPQGMMPGQRPGVPGQQMPQYMNPQLMTRPPTSLPAGATVTTATGQRLLLEDQPLLIQDLLEQEKQEQQKRQAEQRAMMHRHEAGVRPGPEGMMVGPRPGMPPPPGMVPRMEGPVRHPGQPGMFIPPEMAAYRPRVPGQLSPRPPGPQPGMMPMQPGAMRMPGGPMPQPPKPPTPGETGPEAEQQHRLYDTWLVGQGDFLEGQVKYLEQQIQKQKRTKKAINARNRQAKKSGQEPPPQDAMEFERATQELAIFQKQLDQARKQNRQHQMLTQEYRSKQQEHFAQQMAAQGPPPQMVGPPTSGSPMTSIGTPVSVAMQPPQPRMPGAQGSVRLTASARQEYEAYVQSRLRMRGPQGMPGGPRMPGPPPGVIPAAQPRMAIVDNNPFSEEYQEREQMEKMRESHGKQIPPGGPLEKSDESQEAPVPRPPMPHFADPRFQGPAGPTGQPPRFPGPHEQQTWMPARFPYDPATGQRLPGPGDPRFAGPYPPGPPGQMPLPTSGPGPGPGPGPVQGPGYPTDAQTPPTSQPPPGKPPPLQFKPHDETERRIMEILHSTANLQRGQSPGGALAPASSASQVSQGQSPGSIKAESPSPSVITTAANGQSADIATGQATGQGQVQGEGQPPGTPGMAPSSKTPPVQNRLAVGQPPSALSSAAQQGGQVPGSGGIPVTGPPGVAPPHPQLPDGAPNTPGGLSPAPVSSTAVPPSLHPAPPSLQHAPSSHPSSSATTITGPPSLQVAPHVRPPTSVQGPPTMQQAPPGMPVNHPGAAPGHAMPPHPNFPRHLLPGMVPQRPEHGIPMMQRPGFPPMEHMPSLMSRPPMLPHWAAPRQEFPMGGQARRSPRPALPGMNSMTRMGLPHLSMRQGVPHLPGGPHPQGTVAMPPAVSEQMQVSAPSRSPQDDPGQTTIPAGIPRSSPAASPFQPVQTTQSSGPGGANSSGQTLSPAGSGTTVTMVSVVPDPAGDVTMETATASPALDKTDQAIEEESQSSVTGKDSEEEEAKTMQSNTETENPETSADKDEQEETQVSKDSNQSSKECSDGEHCGTPPPQEYTDGLHCGTPPPQECTDGLHCGTPPPQECTDGIHCGTPPPQECTDGLHCGTPPPQECTDGLHCGTPPPQECTDGLHCGTPPPQECTDGIHCGTPPPQECTDGLHCGTPPPQECTDGINCGTPPPKECTDGLHCGTPPPQECTDGLHCGTPPPQECTDGLHCGTPPPQECTDGIHCGTPPPQECTDGLHCGTPPPQECTDGLHCGTPPPQECTDGLHCGTPPPQECTDGLHCGTPPPQECTDGLHCGTPPPQECTDGLYCGTPPPLECTIDLHCGTPPPQECTDGLHCGTPPPQECTDGLHCGTPPPQECTDGLHSGTPPPQECTDGLHCGTPPPQECTDGLHCGTPPPQECTDGLHCGTPPPQECTDGLHCGTPPPQECTDGLHCGTPPPQECTDGLHCGTPPPQECTDGLHCGTPPPQECTDGLHCGTPPPQECTDGLHCGTPPPQECTDGLHCGTPPPQECTDGLHCGTPPPQNQTDHESQPPSQPPTSSEQQTSSGEEGSLTVSVSHDAPPSLQPAMLSPQQMAVQADHQYINVSQPPILVPSHSTANEPLDQKVVNPSSTSSSTQSPDILPTPSYQSSQSPSQNVKTDCVQPSEVRTVTSSQEPNTEIEKQDVLAEQPLRRSPLESIRNSPFQPIQRQSPSELLTQGHSENAGHSPMQQETSQSKVVTTDSDTRAQVVTPHCGVTTGATVSQPSHTSNEQPVTVAKVQDNQENISSSQQQGDNTAMKELNPIQTEQTDAQDAQNKTAVNDSQTSSASLNETEEGKQTTQQTSLTQKSGDKSLEQQEEGLPKAPSDQQVVIKTEVNMEQSTACMHEKSSVNISENLPHAGEAQSATNSISEPPKTAGQSEAGVKLVATSEIKTEPQTTPIPSHLTAVPRPRHFRPVGMPEEMIRQRFPGHMGGRLPYPGQVQPRHPGHMPADFQQQPGHPPVSQQARHPQPAHFHESQLRFMQQMYQHQISQGARPQAAHQAALQQLQEHQQYQLPPGYRGPVPGQPGFPPHFYQQHMIPPGGPRPQHPGAQAGTAPGGLGTAPGGTRPQHPGAQAGTVTSQMPVSQGQSTSPKAQNILRMALPHSMPPGHPRHPGPGIPVANTESHLPPVSKPIHVPDTGTCMGLDTGSVTTADAAAPKPLDKPGAMASTPPIQASIPNVSQSSVNSPATSQTLIKQEPMEYQPMEDPDRQDKTMEQSANGQKTGEKDTSTATIETAGSSVVVKLTGDSSTSGGPSPTDSRVPVTTNSAQSTTQLPDTRPPARTPPVQGRQSSGSTPPIAQGTFMSAQTPASSSGPTTDQQQHISAPPRPLSGHRQSPGHNQAIGQESSGQSSELTLPSVSATFAAAGMMRYGEGMPPYSQGHYRGVHPSVAMPGHGPGFSSVSSIVQSVSSVSFPTLSGQPAQHHIPSTVPPAEVSLPPSTGISSDAVSSGASASTQTPVHHKVGAHQAMVAGQTTPGAHQAMVAGQTTPGTVTAEHTQVDVKPIVTGPQGQPTQVMRPGFPYPEMLGPPGAPGMAGTHGPRMPVPSHIATTTTAAHGTGPRPRGPRQSAQQQQHPNQAAAMARFPRIPSNLPPHLAGMLNNMRGPMPPRHMYPQERHPGMPPMGPMRFPPNTQGMMMPMAPGGPGGYRMPVSQDGTPMSVPQSVGQMQGAVGVPRHPGMMQQAMAMRGMRMAGPGGPMMVPHSMQPPHPSQMSPTGHPGAPPHMHQRMMHPATSAGPLMGPPGMPQPSHPSPKETPSPTQMMPQRPPTPGSMPTTPSPTSFHPGMMPVSTGAPSMAPGMPAEMLQRHRFPGQRMVMRMPYDGRMPFDPNMQMPPRPGMEAAQKMQGFPPDFQMPGMPGNRPGPQEAPQSPSGSMDEALRRMSAGKPGPSPTPSQTGMKSVTPPAGSETTSASTTPPSPMVNIKQEQNLDAPFGLDPNLASQNALLKKLLAKSNAQAAAAASAAISGQSTPQSTDQSEDSNDFSNIQLTPEQQRQLELIEKMPLLKETHPGETAPFVTPEIGDPDIEAKRQEFERRRKEMEEVRKQKRGKGEGPPRKRKKKNQLEGQIQGQIPLQGLPLGLDPLATGEKGQQVDMSLSPEKLVKKRIRKTKKEKLLAEEGNLDGAFDLFMNQLRQLAPVPLMEPLVSHMYAICSLPGLSSTTNTDPQPGIFGKLKFEGEPDYYGDSNGSFIPLLGLNKPRDIAERRKLISDKPDISDQQRYLMMMDSIRNEGQGSTSPFGLGSQLLGLPKSAPLAMPPPPRVEPRVNVPNVTDSPDSMISSSSPETGFCDPELLDYPMLRPIEPAASDEDTRTSPAVPLLQPVPVRIPPFMIKQENQPTVERKPAEVKPPEAPITAQQGKEELDSALSALAGKETVRAGEIDPLTGLVRGAKDPKSDQEVSVTLTLSAKAAEDIGGVLSAIADLLKIAAPPTYEVSRSPSPTQHRIGEKHKEEPLNIHSLARSKHVHMFCRHCDTALLHAGIQKKKSEIPFLTKEEQDGVEDYIRFCSMNCFTNFSITRQMTQKLDPKDLPPLEPKGPLATTFSKEPSLFSPREITPTSSGQVTPVMTPSSTGTDSMILGEITPTKSGPPTPMLSSPTLMRQTSLVEKLGKRVKAGFAEHSKSLIKKWKGVRYKKFELSLFPEVLQTQRKYEDESQLWKRLNQAITYLDMDSEDRPKDSRMCEFCKGQGDGPSEGTGRLLNMDIDKWAHLNCALWSYEVYETLNGALMNVQQAHTRGLKQKCVVCVETGATLTCFKQRCTNIYHVECALLVGCVFFEDKTILCPPHSKIPLEQVLKSLVVYRRVYINRDEDTQVANMLLQEDGNCTMKLGSVVLNSIGQLLPHQIGSGKFNTRDHIYPVSYKSTRFYWSMRTLYRRCSYICSIHDKEGRPEFKVKVVEQGHEEVCLSSNTCKGVWKTILEPIEKMHKEADLVKVFPNFTSGEEFYGLNDPNIVRLIESLPGTDLLKDYIFKFGRRQLIDLPLTINPTGCARAEPKMRTHFRKPHITLHTNSTTHSLPSSVTGLSGDLNSPYMKHFVHSKSQQYRRLKTEWKNLVYLGRSRIQGLGLFAARDLDVHTMVIEYIGELIRNEVANRREKIYEETNRGIYMFRIDDYTVVDATMSGGPARYINHSCDPNCQAEVVELDKGSKIIIITNRRISKGEELTYDYQFDFEDDQHKIPCTCGAHCCRKWMN